VAHEEMQDFLLKYQVNSLSNNWRKKFQKES